ncbi:VWA domain-containing protein [bacterium]|nr:VWA domain-containing protein [bacterium]MBP9808637.1 VWA domain-containing protein [bacterium]
MQITKDEQRQTEDSAISPATKPTTTTTTTTKSTSGSISAQAPTKRSPLVGPVYSISKRNNKQKNSPENHHFTKSMKTTIAAVTVTASLIGAATTISSFAHSVAPTLAPAPVFGTVGGVAVSYDGDGICTKASVAQVDPDYMAPLAALGADGRPIGQCPLSHTTMDAKLSGYVARVNVTQVFTNPYKERIEAVYSFPLSDDSAVDDMTIKIGERTIKGEIKTREAARQIYDNAKNTGHTAALLNQERTNIFTQHVANIDPGKSIVVQLSYVELLKFEDGKYTFAMPTTIGPRFFPNTAVDSDTSAAVSSSNALAQVLSGNNLVIGSDPNPQGRIEPTIASQNLSINVDVNAGMPIKNVSSKLFPIMVDKQNASHSVVSLQKSQNYPNKDFVLTYELDNPDALKSGYLTYRDETAKDKDGYATFMLLPPAKVTPATAAPKEMIFLIDCSGSQSGRPIEKAKETLHYIVNHMNAQDTFQILAFNDQVATLSERPVQAGMAEKMLAHSFISRLNATGGTWMAPAVERVLKQKSKAGDDLKRLRIVTFMTDGYVGNDIEIMSLIQKERKDSRWFAFGTGDGVNRTLIDNVSRLGGGEADYVLLDSSAEEVGKKFYSRIASPALTDVNLKAEGIELYDVYPGAVSDVWANKPLYFTARYRGAGQGKVVLTGYANGRPYQQTLAVTLPWRDTTNSSIEKVWARQKIDNLTDQDLAGLSKGQVNPSIEKAITKVALDHKLMSDFTSFVAVDSAVYGGKSLLTVPVISMPVEGTESSVAAQNNAQATTFAVQSSPANGAISTPSPVYESSPATQPVSDGTAPTLQGATNGAISPPLSSAEWADGSNYQLMQGATNGTIGPQGEDAMVVNGVNTAGTVRVNYLADLEAQANLVANAIEILGVVWGSCTLALCLMRGKSALSGRRTKLIAAVIAIAIGLAVPMGLNWFLTELHHSCIFN